MSFLDGLLDVGKSVVGFFSGGSIASSLAKTALMGYALNRLNKNTNKSNDPSSQPNIDNGVRLNYPEPNTAAKIPVLYGTAYFGGNMFDIQMATDGKTMWYALALCEKTGTTISGTASTYTFKDFYWNNQRVQFKTDGITVDYTRDTAGNIDRSLSGLVKVYHYAGGSTAGQVPESYSGSVPAAYSLFPNWTSGTHTLNNLVFAIVAVTYNRDKGVTGIPSGGKAVQWQVQNSMKFPGDVLYDYMKSTTYGAAIPTADIDTTTLTALNTYSDSTVSYTNRLLNGTTQTGIVLQDRYQINGLLDTAEPVLQNIESVCNASASWLSYDNYEGKWGVIINRAGTSVASFNDSNILGTVSVQSRGLRELYNEAKVEFPHRELRDSADFVSIVLSAGDRNSNEIDKPLGLSYDIINEPVQAKLLGFIELKQSRIDKIVSFQTDFSYINLKPGDIIDITDSRLTFSAKLFRIITISEVQDDGGALSMEITALEYDSNVYSLADMDRYEVSNADGIVGIGVIGIPGTPQVTEVEKDARPRIIVETTAPTGIVEGMEFWLTTDVSVPDDANRSYKLIATTRPVGGGTYGSGTTVTLDYDSLGTTNFIVKTRGINDVTVGPYSTPSGSVFFAPVQTTNAIDANTSMFDSTGGLLTGLALVSLAGKLLDLFGGDTSKSLFDKIFDVFKDETGVDLVGQASGGSLVVASSLAIKNNGAVKTTTAAGIDFQGPFDVTASGSDITFKIKDGTKKNQQLFWDGGEWRIADGCCPATFVKEEEPEVEPEGCRLEVLQTFPSSNTTLSSVTGCGVLTPLVPNLGSYFIKFGNNKGYGLYSNLEKGSGSIKLYQTDGTLIETVSPSSCLVHTDWLEIPFTKARALNTDYYITIDEGAVVYCGCPNRALDEPTTWDFTVSPYKVKSYVVGDITQTAKTSYITPPGVRLVASSFSPNTTQYEQDGDCGADADLKITWSEKVIKGSGSIEIFDTVTNSVVTTKTIASATLEPSGIDNTVVLQPKITNGKLTTVDVKKGGAGFTEANIIFSKPATGEKAEGTVVLSGQQITSITITYAGWGYTSAPTYTLQTKTAKVSEANGNKDRVFNFGSLSTLGLVGGRRYAVRVPAGAAIAAREACPVTNALNEAFAYTFILNNPLQLVSYALCSAPYNNDTAREKVNIRSNIYLKFNKLVKVKASAPANVIIYEKSLILGDTIHQTIDLRKTFHLNKTGALSTFNDVTSTTQNTTSGSSGNLDDTLDSVTSMDLYINPTKPFKPGSTYYIKIASGVLIDAVCDTAWVGVDDKTTITWATDNIDNTTPPAPASNTPAKRVITYELGRPAVPGDGKLNILDSSGNLVTQIDSTNPAVTYSS
jgi:hypothetical protein